MNKIAELKTENTLGKEFKIYGTAEKPLFLAKDVAEWIEHSNLRMMIKKVDEEEKVVNNVYTPGGDQETWFLTEHGVYEILMTSRKPIAKKWKKEVKNILTTIRKHGAYMTQDTAKKVLEDPVFLKELVLTLEEERAKTEKLEGKMGRYKN